MTALYVRGQELQTNRQQRRKAFAVACVREAAVQVPGGFLITFARVIKATDSKQTAINYAYRSSVDDPAPGVVYLVIDLATGEEV